MPLPIKSVSEDNASVCNLNGGRPGLINVELKQKLQSAAVVHTMPSFE